LRPGAAAGLVAAFAAVVVVVTLVVEGAVVVVVVVVVVVRFAALGTDLAVAGDGGWTLFVATEPMLAQVAPASAAGSGE